MIKIRKANKKDMKAVLNLIKELAAFERLPDAVEINQKNLEQDGFGPSKKFECFVAVVNQKIVGMALFYERYSTWKGSTLHLEDLIVTQNMRGNGIGTLLYKEFLNYAYKRKFRRVEWVALNWNTPGIKFYKKTGAALLKDWRTFQMSLEQIEEYLL